MEPPVDVLSTEFIEGELYLSPYVNIKSNVVRYSYDAHKTPITYKEENVSMVIPLFPFVTYYFQKFTSGGFFNFGSDGFIIGIFGYKYKIVNGQWIS